MNVCKLVAFLSCLGKLISFLPCMQITGWGLQFTGNYAISLREAQANLMDISECIRRFYDALYKRFLTNDKFCLTFDTGNFNHSFI